MMRFKITWFRSPGKQATMGKRGSKSVTTLATDFHSLREIVRAFSMACARSTFSFCVLPGWENSFMARTMAATRPRPSSDWSMALGISLLRYCMSGSLKKFSTSANASRSQAAVFRRLQEPVDLI